MSGGQDWAAELIDVSDSASEWNRRSDIREKILSNMSQDMKDDIVITGGDMFARGYSREFRNPFLRHGPLNQQTREEYRASGACLCEDCGEPYLKHPMDFFALSYDDEPYLHVLCNGDRVKL